MSTPYMPILSVVTKTYPEVVIHCVNYSCSCLLQFATQHASVCKSFNY